MTTEADIDGLLDSARSSDTAEFRFSEASHPRRADALDALARAIDRTNASIAALDADLPFGGAPPHVSPGGPAFSLSGADVVDDERIAWWFTRVASALTEAGWTGVLRPQPSEWPEARPHGDPWIAVTMALTGPPPGRGLRRPGEVPAELIPGLTDLTLDWTGAIEGALWFIRVTPVKGDESGVRAALSARLRDHESTFATVHRQDVGAERRVKFSSYGHVTLEERSSLPLEQRLALLRAAWLPWSARLDRSATTGEVGPSHPSRFVERGRRDRKLLQSYYPHGRHLDHRRVPDACVEQLLTQDHLAAARDLSAWKVDEVAPGRFLVAHPDPSRWSLPAPPGEHGTRVDPEVLVAAREDFGDMILSERDL